MTAKQKRSKRLMNALPLIGIAAATFLIILVILFSGITPDQYDIQVGHPASLTIYATKDVEDTVTTKALQEAAANNIEPTYKSVDASVEVEVLSEARSIFDELTVIHADGIGEVNDNTIAAVNKRVSIELSAEMLQALSEISDDEMQTLYEECISKLHDALNSSLPEGQEEAAISRILRDLTTQNYSVGMVDICGSVLKLCTRPNMLIDTETTEANRQKARDSVEPVRLVNREVIVRQGEIVSEAEYQMIADLGLIANDSFDYMLFFGLVLIDLLFCGMIIIYLLLFESALIRNKRKTLLLGIIIILQLLLCFLLRSFNALLMPVSLTAIIMCVLFSRRTAVFISTLLSFLVCLLLPSEYLFSTMMYSILLMGITAGPICALVLNKRQLRSDTLLAGVIIAAANFVCMMAIGMMNSANLNVTLEDALWAMGGALLSCVLAIGTQALLELLFNLPTNAKLIELSNPNQKLLRRLLLEAPGTYHHSIIVANLAEAAAAAIGGDGLLARVGAYYHDIGKLKRPLYYKENQIGENPHDHTDPRVSAAILTAHTRDGAQMAVKEKLPQPIIDIIRQHHGDTMAIFFYDKAIKLYGDDVDQNAFRYEGPRPQSVEAAVVMLADTIEAATRTLKDPTPENMEAQIRKLVTAKMTDGQLNESPLTFADLDKICSTFVTVLTGVFHQRIEYPDIHVPARTEETDKTVSEVTLETETIDINHSEAATNDN